MKCPKCGSVNIQHRVSFYDDDEKGKFYIREDGSRNSNKKIKWYDDFYEARKDMKHNLPCGYPYFERVETFCRDCHNEILLEREIYQAHKEALEYDKYLTRLNKVLSVFEKNKNPKSNEYYYNTKNGLLMAIDLDREERFSLYNNEFPIYISINTVEALLKDLGGIK